MNLRRCAHCLVGALLLTLVVLPEAEARAYGNAPTGYEAEPQQPRQSKPKSWPRQYGEYKTTPKRERGKVRSPHDENGWYSSGVPGYYGYWRGGYGFYRPWYYSRYRPYGWYGWHSHYGY